MSSNGSFGLETNNVSYSNSGGTGFVRATLSVGEAFQPRFAHEDRGWKATLTGISTQNLNKIRKLFNISNSHFEKISL